jgi:hypothetical protein
MKKLYTALSICILGITFWGCKKDSEYTPVPAACKCGSISWYGKTYQVSDANGILMDSTEVTSRQYYVTVDITEPTIAGKESINLLIGVPDVLAVPPLELNQDIEEFAGDAQVVQLVNNTDLTYRYKIASGTISVNPGLFGGNDNVSFSLQLDPLFGSSEDPLIPVSGSFTVNVNY